MPIVEIKFIIVCEDLNFRFFNILLPTAGVTPKKTQLDLFKISWLSLTTIIFLLFLLNSDEIFKFLFEI